MLQPIWFFVRLFALIFATLISLRILFVLVQRLPGVVVALSAISLLMFAIAYYRGGWKAIGIRTRKSSAIAAIVSAILLVISTVILLKVK